MGAPASTEPGGRQAQETGCYVYGVVPADVELAAGAHGIGNPPGRVGLVHHHDIAALVSDIDLGNALGTPDDLRAHAQILDAAAAEVPVLPLRFGAVMTSPQAVADELLAPHHDEFAAALTEIEGHAEYVVKGRYLEQAALAEVLAQLPEAARLAGEIKGTDEHASRPARMQLGELINEAITAKRQADTAELGGAVAPYCVASVVREPAHELDAVNVALLVPALRQADLEQAIADLEQDWDERIELRLLGPLAPWDFIHAPTAEPE
jgi:Gas vesicle synthesis protein GvpL/GvpF